MDADGKITELGVAINDSSVDKSKIKTNTYNSKFKIFREFILATLSALAETKSKRVYTKEPLSQVYALDASSCTVIAGLQWKRHLPGSVHVTVATQDDTKRITENAMANSLSCSELKLNPQRVPGDLLGQQTEKEVHICQAEAKTVMMMEAYNFIYLNPKKNCATYFDSAMHSITSDGLLCVIVPDVSLFARSSHVVQRFYAADVVKTEYLKELAARIILASLARAAARYIKGISPQYVLSHEDCLLICVKISRGHKVADSSIAAIERLLHCRLCEERTFIPNQLAPLDDPYSLLACSCKKNNPGKTAVILGPIWKDSISDPWFLAHLHRQGQQLKLSSKFLELVNLILTESLCATADRDETVLQCSGSEQKMSGTGTKDLSDSNIENNISLSETVSSSTAENSVFDQISKSLTSDSSAETQMEISSAVDEPQETENGLNHAIEQQRDQAMPYPLVQKRKAENILDSTDSDTKSKHQRLDKEDNATKSANVPFYYSITKFKKSNIPKLAKIVTILHCSGHRASRTHFDPCAIRTSASVQEFVNIFG